MSERQKFIETMAELNKVMDEHREAHNTFVKAASEANSLFCAFANKFGWRQADSARKDAHGH